MLKLQHDDVIIYEVSRDFDILFDMWNKRFMNYLEQNFTVILLSYNVDTCIFLCTFRQNDMSQHNAITIYDVTVRLSLSYVLLQAERDTLGNILKALCHIGTPH